MFAARDTEKKEATGLDSFLAMRVREKEKALSPAVLTRKI